MDKSVDIEFLEPTNYALLAVQGPKAEEALQELANINLQDLYFMTTSMAEVAGVPDCRITRCGYTGEDGFEVAIPGYRSTQVLTALKYSKTPVKMAGLGARDSLRLEAGLCLYGNDIDTTVTPIEAGLTWLVGKDLENCEGLKWKLTWS
jgi:aminomethyltransferase